MFSALRTPKAMEGMRQAKYRNRVVDRVFWMDLGPTIPVNSGQFGLHNVYNLFLSAYGYQNLNERLFHRFLPGYYMIKN